LLWAELDDLDPLRSCVTSLLPTLTRICVRCVPKVSLDSGLVTQTQCSNADEHLNTVVLRLLSGNEAPSGKVAHLRLSR
jgi:hypothetical protein